MTIVALSLSTSEYSYTWLYQGDGWTISIDKMDTWTGALWIGHCLTSFQVFINHQGANCSTFMKKGFIQKILEKVLKWAPKCAMIPKRKSYLAKKSFPLGSNTSWLMQMRVDCTHCVNLKKAKFGIKQPNFKGIIDSFLEKGFVCHVCNFCIRLIFVSGNIRLVAFNFCRRKNSTAR